LALLKGNNMQFTWSLSNEGPTTETRGFRWTLATQVRMYNTTPEATDTWEEYTEGMTTGNLEADFNIDSATTPPLPIGATGVAVLYLNKSGGGRSYTCQAKCMGQVIAGQSNTGGAPQVARYRFQVTLNGATAGIVAA
jgi:hypothetical protein